MRDRCAEHRVDFSILRKLTDQDLKEQLGVFRCGEALFRFGGGLTPSWLSVKVEHRVFLEDAKKLSSRDHRSTQLAVPPICATGSVA